MGCCGSSPSKEEATEVVSDSTATNLKDNSTSPREVRPKTEPNAVHKNNKSVDNPKNETAAETSPKAVEQNENSKSSAELSWNLDGDLPDNRKAEFKLRISQRASEIEEEEKRLADIKTKMFARQVSRQKEKAFVGLYDLFQQHATNESKTKMDIDGVTSALKEFGMIIDSDRGLQKFVWSKFDIDKEGEIDYNDFMATLSSLIGTKNEDALLTMFQIFDNDQDGYLNTGDMAMIILAQNQIALAVTGHVEDANANQGVVLTKKVCLKLARKIITKYDNANFKDSKISFDEYKEMMMHTNVEEMMITNKDELPSMDSIATPSGYSGGTPDVDFNR